MPQKIKIRSFLIGGLFTLFFVIIVARLYWVQVVTASDLVEKAEVVWRSNNVLPSTRGAIYDRSGSVLAWNAQSYTVAVNPKLIAEHGVAREVVDGLAPLLGMTSDHQYRKLQQIVTKKRDNGDYYLHVEVRNEGWKIDNDIGEQIRKLNLTGVYLLPEQKRYYPFGSLASHVLGYINKEGNAVMGIEYVLDDLLRGQDGEIHYAKDNLGYELPGGRSTYEPPINGKSVKLTIDQQIQHYMETALEKVYTEYSPISATAIAADPRTMEILGLANYPNFDPNVYWDIESQAVFYNHAISSVYEPGSTFKIVTLAAAEEEGEFDPEETFMSGGIQVADAYIRDHNGRGWGEITFREGLLRSSNVAFVKLGQALGGEKLRDYISRFGFGEKTGIELNSEMAGDVRFNLNYPTEVATVTFGQGQLMVTGLQQLTAVSAIANEGKLMKPYLVKEIIDSDTGHVMESFTPQFVRQVISPETAKRVSGYLEEVISDDRGTGKLARIDGYKVAGKTGTAQKVVNGKYAKDQFVLSFIGFAPAEDPRIALIVIVDDPKIDSYVQGTSVVGPVFREIMEKSLRYLGVESEKNASNVNVVKANHTLPQLRTPDLVSQDPVRAADILEARGLNSVVLGSGHKVLSQFPEAGTEIGSGQRIILLTEEKSQQLVPDLTGLSLRDAMEICSYLGVEVRISGEGYVVSQSWLREDDESILRIQLQPPGQALRSVEADPLDELEWPDSEDEERSDSEDAGDLTEEE